MHGIKNISHHILKLLRSSNRIIRGNTTDEYMTFQAADIAGQDASNCIRDRLEQDAPCMIGRFGSTEMNCLSVLRYERLPESVFLKSFKYINGTISQFWRDDSIGESMSKYSGFFPINDKSLDLFYRLMLESMKQVDILGTWLETEKAFAQELQHCTRVSLPDLEPYYHQDPWSVALTGKRVLVIHPFVKSIRNQYQRRHQLFKHPGILPEFELKTLKAVQSIAHNPCGFDSWFDAYRHMCDEAAAIDFDIAIIGCGAYGFPLAAFIKGLGKKAVHLGGATQILFGIRGRRWEQHEAISRFFNDNWVNPLAEEAPENHRSVEQGCYW